MSTNTVFFVYFYNITHTHTGFLNFLFAYIIYQMAMEIHDTDIVAGMNSCFGYATKCNRYFYQIAF